MRDEIRETLRLLGVSEESVVTITFNNRKYVVNLEVIIIDETSNYLTVKVVTSTFDGNRMILAGTVSILNKTRIFEVMPHEKAVTFDD